MSLGMTPTPKGNCITLPDDFEGYNKELFLIPPHYQDSVANVLIPRGLVLDRTEKLANDIFQRVMNNGKEPMTLLCVLKGGHQFFSELQDKLNILNSNNRQESVQMSMEFIRLRSYVDTGSSGKVEVIGLDDMDKTFKGKNLLVVEDIIDTGKSMKKLLATLSEHSPKSVTVVCLLRKRTRLSDGYIPDFVGFEIPDRFVIGHGFDYNEYFRDMLHICVINEHGIKKYKA